jgi:filamentous hemagglutinin family protein
VLPSKLKGLTMKTRTTLSLVTLPLFISTTALAEVTLDGTLGSKGALPGPDYQIGADFGQQHGGNLFHSFQDFNLQSHERATFSGPDNVQNVISRVTGGNPSSIDGTIRSTMPNADMYFLNPSGMVFGPNARLDVPGSFHASTADYLRFRDGGKFEARQVSNSLLTVAPIAAFGFVTDSPASIQTHSSKLSVPAEKTLSLIGGDLHLTSDIPLTADNSQPIPPVMAESILATEHGRVNLASLASHGEVIPSENDLTLQGQGGNITMENSLVELSGNGGGAAFIRAGQFFLDNAIIRSNTFGDQEGQDINLKVTEAAYLSGINSEISVITASGNNAGRVWLEAPYLEMTGAAISTGSFAEGAAGSINIYAKQAFLKDGAFIVSGTFDVGQGGDISLTIADNLSILGFAPGPRNFHSLAFENIYSLIDSSSLGSGPAGNIRLNTQTLNLEMGSIGTDVYGDGKGGDITIEAKSIRLDAGATISSSSFGTAQATGGNLNIKAVQVHLAGTLPVDVMAVGNLSGKGFPSYIGSGSFGAGDGGTIAIEANKLVLTERAGISISAFSTGNGGTITVDVNELILTERGSIDAQSDGLENAGEAGNIFIQANTLRLTEGGSISAESLHATGGNIRLGVANLLYLQNSQITTSVLGGMGDGGNITLDNPQFVVMNHSNIIAQADTGHGGNIHIVAQQFLKTPDSVVSASSRLGIDGQVLIESPDQTIGDNLLASPTEFTDLTGFLPRFCEKLSFEEFVNRSTFYIYPIAGDPLSPYDLKPSQAFRSVSRLPTVGQRTVSKERREGKKQSLAWLTGCH